MLLLSPSLLSSGFLHGLFFRHGPWASCREAPPWPHSENTGLWASKDLQAPLRGGDYQLASEQVLRPTPRYSQARHSSAQTQGGHLTPHDTLTAPTHSPATKPLLPFRGWPGPFPTSMPLLSFSPSTPCPPYSSRSQDPLPWLQEAALRR